MKAYKSNDVTVTFNVLDPSSDHLWLFAYVVLKKYILSWWIFCEHTLQTVWSRLYTGCTDVCVAEASLQKKRCWQSLAETQGEIWCRSFRWSRRPNQAEHELQDTTSLFQTHVYRVSFQQIGLNTQTAPLKRGQSHEHKSETHCLTLKSQEKIIITLYNKVVQMSRCCNMNDKTFFVNISIHYWSLLLHINS